VYGILYIIEITTSISLLNTTITRDIVGHEKPNIIFKVGMNGCKVGGAVAEHWICIAPHLVISIYIRRTIKSSKAEKKSMCTNENHVQKIDPRRSAAENSPSRLR
jgi:hypothetical protein